SSIACHLRDNRESVAVDGGHMASIGNEPALDIREHDLDQASGSGSLVGSRFRVEISKDPNLDGTDPIGLLAADETGSKAACIAADLFGGNVIENRENIP